MSDGNALALGPRIIGDDSPLNRLPAALDKGQLTWLEGVRFSVELLDVTMRRLRTMLHGLGQFKRQEPGPGLSEPYLTALTDAWAIVDAMWRIKRFLVDTPLPRGAAGSQPLPLAGGAQKSFSLGLDKDLLRTIKTVRDRFQHPDTFLDEIQKMPGRVYGCVTWLVADPTNPLRGETLALVRYSGGDAHFPLIDPAGKVMHGSLDHVTLNAYGHAISLSEIHRSVARIVNEIETVLRPQFEGQTTVGVAAIVALQFTFAGEEGTP